MSKPGQAEPSFLRVQDEGSYYTAGRSWWQAHRTTLLRIAIVLMGSAALVWLTYQFWRLVWQTGTWGAVDLGIRYREVAHWFADRRRPYYYPPATYVMLWPFLGWLDWSSARWLWAMTTLGMLAWFASLLVRITEARETLERTFIVLMLLSMYATGATIGNGQLNVHLLPCLLAGFLWLSRAPGGWTPDVVAAMCIVLALVKPSVSAPFFWIVLFMPGRLRPACLVVCGYLALTLLALSLRTPPSLADPEFLKPALAWPTTATRAARASAPAAVANLHTLLTSFGFKAWTTPASVCVLLMLGGWTYVYRRVDVWVLAGVTAIIARFWTYHRWFDDLLIVIPMLAVFRRAKHRPLAPGYDLIAGVLFALAVVAMLAPGGLYLFPPPWNDWYVMGQVLIWLSMLLFLLDQARREHRKRETQSESSQ